MNAFTLRRRTRALVATVAAVAALSLTACQDDELVGGGADQGSSEQEGTTGGTDESTGGEETEETGVEPGQGTVEGGAGEDGSTPCTDLNTEVTVSPVERPINHLLLTATNTGDEACLAYNAPFLGYEGAQAPLPWVEDSIPQAVVVLEPGQSAYAGLITSSGASAEGFTVTSLSLSFAQAEGGSAGDTVDLSLPGGEVFLDDAAAVTYWQTSMDDALMW
ncbi:DUF4232 domain-containing protein [Streptomyces sp. 8K308]|uniref:DUF4232 domain-containing protein n=1 Tax=Streptomyces sp. 8K308 TaxID=2530388 RepID=UPI0010447A2A|nr:DUF4232 domain-containing protein [Streptomyces sp. 8K308]TDC25886.1 DUF4232 domain-containing protein [Streptomyces sp. 8K308]